MQRPTRPSSTLQVASVVCTSTQMQPNPESASTALHASASAAATQFGITPPEDSPTPPEVASVPASVSPPEVSSPTVAPISVDSTSQPIGAVSRTREAAVTSQSFIEVVMPASSPEPWSSVIPDSSLFAGCTLRTPGRPKLRWDGASRRFALHPGLGCSCPVHTARSLHSPAAPRAAPRSRRGAHAHPGDGLRQPVDHDPQRSIRRPSKPPLPATHRRPLRAWESQVLPPPAWRAAYQRHSFGPVRPVRHDREP